MANTNTFDLPSLKAFDEWVKEFRKNLQSKQLILLIGEMGSGKTQWVQSLLSSQQQVMSPTFAIHNEYEVSGQSVDHFDLYRLQNDEDLESTGFWEVFEKDQGWVIVEWADRLPRESFPHNWPTVVIHIKKNNDDLNSRKITVIR